MLTLCWLLLSLLACGSRPDTPDPVCWFEGRRVSCLQADYTDGVGVVPDMDGDGLSEALVARENYWMSQSSMGGPDLFASATLLPDFVTPSWQILATGDYEEGEGDTAHPNFRGELSSASFAALDVDADGVGDMAVGTLYVNRWNDGSPEIETPGVRLLTGEALLRGETSLDDFHLISPVGLDDALASGVDATGWSLAIGGALNSAATLMSGLTDVNSSDVTLASFTGEALGAPVLVDLDGSGRVDWVITEALDTVHVFFDPLTTPGARSADDSDVQLTQTDANGIQPGGCEGGATWSDFGARVLAMADISGDGLSELVVGDAVTSADEEGSVYVFDASVLTSGPHTSDEAFVTVSDPSADCIGRLVADVGDVDGDGFTDLAAASTDALTLWGGSVLRGGGNVALADSFETWTSETTAVSGADFDGDGFSDVLLAQGYRGAGGTFIVYGQP